MPEPFEQVVEATFQRVNPSPVIEIDRDTIRVVLRESGLLKLVEERPEEPRESFINETAKVANRNYGTGGNPEAALYSAGHQPEGPSEEPSVEAVATLDSMLGPNFRFPPGEERTYILWDLLRTVYAIDHPQDREAK